VGVISSLPECRVVFFLDDQHRNVVRQWMIEQDAPDADFVALQALIEICEACGLHAIAHCTSDLGNGFYALKVQRKGGIFPSPVFCQGPFNSTEITFLAGARMEGKKIEPRYAVGIAEENLEKLLKEPGRKRHERIG
jgi:hypothetical protein